MSYWLYIQTAINLALAGACGYLYLQQRRSRAQGAWRQELGPLVETLGELLVEIDRLAVRDPQPKAVPTAEVSEVSPVVPSPAPARRPVVAVTSKAAAAYTQAAPAQTSASAPTSAPAFSAPTAPTAPTAPVTPAQPTQPSPVAPVLELAAQGMDADQIAERLGRPIGEVTLVLGLRSSFAASA